MDRSSTPCAASRRRLLAARDARQERIDAAVRAARGAVVALSLAVPGADKAPRGADALFAWAALQVADAFGDARAVHAGVDALGPFALWEVGLAPALAKAACVAIEGSRAAARLLDLDVYAPEGAPIDRAALGLPPRPCLACDASARECIALRRHAPDDLARRALALLSAP